MNSMNIVKGSSIMNGMVIWELYKGANKVHGIMITLLYTIKTPNYSNKFNNNF